MTSYSVTIQMEATEQYYPVVLFIMLYNSRLSLWITSRSMTIQMKATEHFPSRGM